MDGANLGDMYRAQRVPRGQMTGDCFPPFLLSLLDLYNVILCVRKRLPHKYIALIQLRYHYAFCHGYVPYSNLTISLFDISPDLINNYIFRILFWPPFQGLLLSGQLKRNIEENRSSRKLSGLWLLTKQRWVTLGLQGIEFLYCLSRFEHSYGVLVFFGVNLPWIRDGKLQNI